ncbi:MAG: hypothetical protein Q4G58_06300 [bacterium]|nr:hypothetical protein [bacterium]
MSIDFRKEFTIKGGMTFTGNTLGLAKKENELNAGIVNSIGTFTSLNTNIKQGNFPLGTTLNSAQNGSYAYLNLPQTAQIVYAELLWAGTCALPAASGYPAQTITNQAIDSNVITLQTPDRTNRAVVVDDNTIKYRGTNVTNQQFYVRSKDVTDLLLLSSRDDLRFAVSNVPALIGQYETQNGYTCFAGWTLMVIYEDHTMPLRNMVLSVGGEIINSYSEDVIIPYSHFVTPKNGNFNARILITTAEGDTEYHGDSVYFAPTMDDLKEPAFILSGPRNPSDNFFCSQINKDDGTLDESGSFGTLNNIPDPIDLMSAARQGWDITNINASRYMTNNQQNAFLRLTTSQDIYMPMAIGTQIDMEQLNLTVIKSATPSDNSLVSIDQTITYTLSIANDDASLDGKDIHILDSLPTGLSFVPNSVKINGVENPSNITTGDGVTIPDLPPNSSPVIVTFDAVVSGLPTPNTTYDNIARVTFTYSPAPTITKTVSTFSNIIKHRPFIDSSSFTKTVTPDRALTPLSTQTFTLSFTNNSNETMTRVTLMDSLDSQYTLISEPTSLFDTGITYLDIPAGETVSTSYTVQIKQGTNRSLKNNASASYTYTSGFTGTKTAAITTPILVPSIDIVKRQNKNTVIKDDTVIYSLRIRNTGFAPLANLSISDLLPTGLTYVQDSLTINNEIISGPIDLSDYTLPAKYALPNNGSTITIQFTVRVNDISEAPFTNNASVQAYYPVYNSDGTISQMISDQSNDVILNAATPTLNVSKQADKTLIKADGTDIVTYRIRVQPSGSATNFILQEGRPITLDKDTMSIDEASITVNGIADFTLDIQKDAVGDVIGFTVTIPSIAATDDITITFEASASKLEPGGSSRTFSNTADYEYYYPKDPENPTEEIKVDNSTFPPQFVTQAAINLDLTKVITNEQEEEISQAFVGDTVTVSIGVSNPGDTPVEVNIIEDRVLELNKFTPVPGSITLKTNTGADVPFTPSIDPITGIITVALSTPQELSTDEGLTLSFKAVALNKAAGLNYDYGVVKFNEPDSTFIQTVLTPIAELFVANPSIQISKQADIATVEEGDSFEYELLVTNTGNIRLTNVSLSDTKLAAYIANANLTINGDITVNGSVLQTPDLSNVQLPNLEINAVHTILIPVTATLLPDSNVYENTATVSTIATIESPRARELKVRHEDTSIVNGYYLNVILTKSAAQEVVKNGDTISYTITVENASSVAIDHAYVQDIIPKELIVDEASIIPAGNLELGIDVGPMQPGETATVTFDAIVDNPDNIGEIQNCAYVNYSHIWNDVTICGQSSVACFTIRYINPEISVIKSAPAKEYILGSQFDYTITIKNTGLTPITRLEFSDLLPVELSLTSKTIVVAQGDNSTTVSIDLTTPDFHTLPYNFATDNTDIILTIPVTVTSIPNPASPTDYLDNIATILYYFNQNDEEQSLQAISNKATVRIIYPLISTSKQAYPITAKLGSTILYMIRIDNHGNTPLTNITVTDTLPEGMEFVEEFSWLNGLRYPATITEGIKIATLYTGGIATISFLAKITEVANDGIYINRSTYSYNYRLNDEFKSITNQKTNEAVVTISTGENASMSIVKSSSDQTVRRGDIVDYMLVVSNTGDTLLTDIIIKDTLPSGLEFVSGSLAIDGTATDYDITSDAGVPLPTLDTKDSQNKRSSIITFRVKATSPLQLSYHNTATGTYNYETSTGIVTGTSTSNTHILRNAALSVTKEVDKTQAAPGDTLNYTVIIKNEGNTTITDLNFLEFTDTKVIVDTSNVMLNDLLVTGFPNIEIGTLAASGYPDDTAILTYSAKIKDDVANSSIVNKLVVKGSTIDNKDLVASDYTVTNLLSPCKECPECPKCDKCDKPNGKGPKPPKTNGPKVPKVKAPKPPKKSC